MSDHLPVGRVVFGQLRSMSELRMWTVREPVEAAVEIKRLRDEVAGLKCPPVTGRCPEGCGDTLFLGTGGYVTCSLITCPDPTAASDLLAGESA